jgi:glycosyltransferase involved in cell wall biosynthesis
MTRVLLLTQWFDPEPTFKGLFFAKSLQSLGFEVEVVTGFPNYPGGKIYPGYKIGLLKREVVEGVHVTRLPLYPSHSGSAFGRICNYLSFGAVALGYCLFRARRPDVVYAYHPPLTVAIAAAVMRFFRRTPVVLDVQDLWPDTLKSTGMFSSRSGLAIIAKVCNWVYRHVDQVVVLSPGFKRLLMERGVPGSHIEIIFNWCHEDALRAPVLAAPKNFPGGDRFRILYAGNMGKAQALSAVLDAAKLLETRAPKVSFIFLGGGVELETLKRRVERDQSANVVFIPAVPMHDVGAYLQSADALLVHLKKDPLFEITIPSKTQAYMAIGKPILMAVGGDAAELVLRAGGGVVAESENAASIADAAAALAEADITERKAMGDRGRKFYFENLALDIGARSFESLFLRLSASRR